MPSCASLVLRFAHSGGVGSALESGRNPNSSAVMKSTKKGEESILYFCIVMLAEVVAKSKVARKYARSQAGSYLAAQATAPSIAATSVMPISSVRRLKRQHLPPRNVSTALVIASDKTMGQYGN
jgi:hypothetical protein